MPFVGAEVKTVFEELKQGSPRTSSSPTIARTRIKTIG